MKLFKLIISLIIVVAVLSRKVEKYLKNSKTNGRQEFTNFKNCIIKDGPKNENFKIEDLTGTLFKKYPNLDDDEIMKMLAEDPTILRDYIQQYRNKFTIYWKSDGTNTGNGLIIPVNSCSKQHLELKFDLFVKFWDEDNKNVRLTPEAELYYADRKLPKPSGDKEKLKKDKMELIAQNEKVISSLKQMILELEETNNRLK